MSGDGFGALVAIGLAVMFLPLIIKVTVIAAAIGVATTVAAGLIGAAGDIKEAIELKNKQKVTNCSKDLDQLYSQLNNAFIQQAQADEEFYKTMADTFKDVETNLKAIDDQEIDTEGFETKINQMTTQAFKEFEKKKTSYLETRDADNKELQQTYLDAYKDAVDLKTELLNFRDQSATARAQQRGVAELVLKDAKASVDLLKLMAESSKSQAFVREVNAIIRELNNATNAFNNGNYETAIASSRRIVVDSAVLNYEQSDRDLRLTEMRAELRAKLNSLKAQMETARYVKYNMKDITGKEKDDREMVEDLNKYSQHRYEAFQQQIDQLLDHLPDIEGQNDEEYQLHSLDERFTNQLMGQADQIIKESAAYLLNRHRELELIQRMNKFMKQQNYKLDWIENAGDDLTGKIVVHYVNRSTKDTMVFTLDNDDPIADPHNIVIEQMNFYDGNVTFTEQDLARFREKMLESIGVKGHIACDRTTANKGAKNKDYNDQNKVLDLKDIKTKR